MADNAEAPAVEEQDTPTNDTEPEAPQTEDTPTEADDTPEIPDGYIPEERYNNLRSEADRTKQFMSALEGKQGPEAQQAAYERLGLQVIEDEAESEDEYLDPDERMDRLEQQLREREEQAQEQEFQAREDAWIGNALKGVEKAEDRSLSDEEREIITSFAISHRFEDGQPDIEGGHERLKAIYSAAQKRLVDSKRNAPKPPQGVAGDEKIDTSTPEGRRKAIAQTFEAHQAAASE